MAANPAIFKEWRHQKSDCVNRCVFTRRTILPNFIPLRFETTEPSGFLEQRRPLSWPEWHWLVKSLLHSEIVYVDNKQES